MPLVNFIEILFLNIPEYLMIVLITSIIYCLLFHKHIFSLFDPMLFVNIVSSIFATSTVVFLYKQKRIQNIYFVNYFITLIIFWTIFYFFGKKIDNEHSIKFKYKTKRIVDSHSQQIIIDNSFFTYYVVFAIMNIFIQLFFYAMTGIPLFMNSRLEVTMKGGALIAILSRIKPLFETTSIFMNFYILTYSHGTKRLFGKFYFGCIFLFYFLSGSRSVFFSLIFEYAVFVYFTQKSNRFGIKFFTNIKIFYLMIIALLFTLIIFSIQGKGNIFDAFTSLFVRFTAYGDAYVYGYVNDNLLKVEKINILYFIFGDFLDTFRLSIGKRALGYGFALNNIVYNITNSVSGPNSRFNLVTYSYFGFEGSLIAAFIFGSIFTFSRNKLIAAVQEKPQNQVVAYFFYNICSAVETEPVGVIRFMTTDLFIQFCVFIVLFILLFYSINRGKNNNCLTVSRN